MKNFIGLLAVMLFPVLALAQNTKPAPLAEYVSFCLALWKAAPDVASKATALELRDATGSTGALITIGKTTIQFYKSARGDVTVGATSTAFADGQDYSCDVNLATGVERADLEAMERALDLDGQIVTFGPATLGRWKIRGRQPSVLLKAIAGKNIGTLTVQTLQASIDDGASRSR